MYWIQKNNACFNVYYCSRCYSEIMVEDSADLPCYCDFCEEDADDAEEE